MQSNSLFWKQHPKRRSDRAALKIQITFLSYLHFNLNKSIFFFSCYFVFLGQLFMHGSMFEEQRASLLLKQLQFADCSHILPLSSWVTHTNTKSCTGCTLIHRIKCPQGLQQSHFQAPLFRCRGSFIPATCVVIRFFIFVQHGSGEGESVELVLRASAAFCGGSSPLTFTEEPRRIPLPPFRFHLRLWSCGCFQLSGPHLFFLHISYTSLPQQLQMLLCVFYPL